MTDKPKRPATNPAWKTSEDRDLAAIERRRAEQAATDTAITEENAPIDARPEEDITRPVQLIERSRARYDSDDIYRAEMDAIRDRYAEDPAFRAIWNVLRRQRRESNKTMGAVASTALAAHAAPPAELVERVDFAEEKLHRIDTALGIAKWLMGLAIAAALASIITVAVKIWGAGYADGEMQIRVDHLERDVLRLQSGEARKLFDLLTPDPKGKP